MTNIDLESIDYLAEGSDLQKRAFQILKDLEVFENLSDDHPTLVGSVPLDLALELSKEQSGIDIVRTCSDLKVAAKRDRELFSKFDHFQSSRGIFGGVPSLMTQFQVEDVRIHLVTQALPTPVQSPVVHMLVQYRLLEIGGASFRAALLDLRRKGQTTESAFATLLGMENPYQELLDLDDLTDHELRLRFAGRMNGSLTGSTANDA